MSSINLGHRLGRLLEYIMSSGPQVSVTKTYRDETKTKMNISARSQWPSSAVEYRTLKQNFQVLPRQGWNVGG